MFYDVLATSETLFWTEAMGRVAVTLNGHNVLAAVSFSVHPLDSCRQTVLLRQQMSFSFLPNGSNDHKIFRGSFPGLRRHYIQTVKEYYYVSINHAR